VINRSQFDKIREGNDSALLVRVKTSPVPQMLFRPEEVHGASGVGHVLWPFPKGNRYVPNQSFGITVQHFPVLDIQAYWFATIETGRFKMDCFAWEKPADCRRFESSLGKPFLLTIDGDSILIWQTVKWCH
jgi:hypothetical protein